MRKYFKQFPLVVWIQAEGHALTSFISIILLPFLTLYMYDQFENNLIVTTLIIGVQPFTEILFTFLLGGWIDRFGRRSVMLGSLLFQLGAMIGFIFASSIWAFLFFLFINGLGRFVYIPAARAQISDTIHHEKQSETFALLNTASSIGALGGPLLGAFLFQYNEKLLFAWMALLILIYTLICLRWLPESKPAGVKKEVKKQNSTGYKKLGWLACGMLPLSLFHAQMETNWPVFLKENIGNYLFLFSLLETIGTIVFILFEVVLINRTQKFARRHVILAGYLLYALAAIGFGFSYHLSGFILSQLLFCVGAILTLNHMQTTVSLLAPDENKGRYFALFGLHWDLSRSLGPLLGGLLLSQFGGEALFLTVTILILIGGLSQTKALNLMDPEPDRLKETG
ncbi:MFS transporter [Halobacillus litoralis]|uniref:MFS transporter n=1 Tax=Halobacillus litoralis TaxID=45668 RepID=UPI001CFE2A1C|nr:MFS transporter [Halobacillus litoralis]